MKLRKFWVVGGRAGCLARMGWFLHRGALPSGVSAKGVSAYVVVCLGVSAQERVYPSRQPPPPTK